MDREILLKQISTLLDETIVNYQSALEKSGANVFQSDSNGDMPQVAGQAKDVLDAGEKAPEMKKEDEDEKKDDEKKDDEKEDEKKDGDKKEELEKEDEDEKKDDEKKDDEKEDEKKDDEEKVEKSEDVEFEKFMGHFTKAMIKLGLIKSEDDLDIKDEEKVEKSDKKDDELSKSLESKLKGLETKISELSETVEKIAQKPAGSRKSLDGISALKKFDEDEGSSQPLNKTAVLEKLLAIQAEGKNPRVTPQLLAKFELTGNTDLVKGIIN